MQSLGKVLLTGAAVVVLWKVMVGLFAGLLLLAMKVGLVLLAVYFLLKIFNGKKDQEE
ncbi:MAG: hypothetical protein PVJ76_07945 [Gemmatimonadota bacterium]|jgi:hypothetical protein